MLMAGFSPTFVFLVLGRLPFSSVSCFVQVTWGTAHNAVDVPVDEKYEELVCCSLLWPMVARHVTFVCTVLYSVISGAPR